jgi:hypothetical protein
MSSDPGRLTVASPTGCSSRPGACRRGDGLLAWNELGDFSVEVRHSDISRAMSGPHEVRSLRWIAGLVALGVLVLMRASMAARAGSGAVNTAAIPRFDQHWRPNRAVPPLEQVLGCSRGVA